jgi:hypothetical protein
MRPIFRTRAYRFYRARRQQAARIHINRAASIVARRLAGRPFDETDLAARAIRRRIFSPLILFCLRLGLRCIAAAAADRRDQK